MGVEGIDVPAVTAWMQDRVAALEPPLEFEVIPGGRSNLSYRVSDTAGGRWVLRRPPLHGVLESAHDMGREHRIQAALQDTPVPVPPLVGYEADPEVTGAEFYVMDFVDGLVARDADVARDHLTPAARGRAGESLVEVLVELHRVDPDAAGLGDLARKEGYIARQLKRWLGQYEKGSERDIPAIPEVHDRLAAGIPDQGPATIVHGDYRLDNLILSPEGDVQAVLDWELCTLGDPLADVGLLMVYWTETEAEEILPLGSAPTTVDGFPGRQEVAARYAELSGRDISQLDFYVAFGYWKLAVILEGVYTRFAAGAYEHQDEGVRAFGDIVLKLAEKASEAAASAGR